MSRVRHPAALPNCVTCSGWGMVAVPAGERVAGELCPCVGECPQCRDTGFVRSEDKKKQHRCVCWAARRRFASFGKVGIPARYHRATLDSFVAKSVQQKAFVASVRGFVSKFGDQPDRGLVMYGGVGRGKTHLMLGLLRELVLEHGVTARFIEFSHLINQLKASFERGSGGVGQLMDELASIDVLAIDELGKGRNTEFEMTIVDELVSRRYNAMRPLLATSNYGIGAPTGQVRENAALAALGQRNAQTLVDRLGERVYSRLRETANFINITGEDYRELKKQGAR